jgi:photosystem II stability/assembly factor-like uncharacterized protein
LRLAPLFHSFAITSALVANHCLAAQQGQTSGEQRMAMFEKHQQMLQSSPFQETPWQFLGPKNISGRVTDIAVAVPGKTFYVAGASGGVWRTDDNGDSWRPVFEQGPSTSIGDVTVAPSNPDTVWIGSGEANIFRSSMAGCGLFKSNDGGKHFHYSGLAGTHTIARIVIHPQDPQTVYVAASGHEWTDNPERGIYKTTDGGKSWSKILYIDERTGAIDVVMHPNDPNTLYAATWQRIRQQYNDPRNEKGYGKSGIYKTTNGGKDWTHLDKGLPQAKYRGRIGLDLCNSKPETVYAFVDNYELSDASIKGSDSYGRQRGKTIKGAEVYRSDNGGAKWRKTSQSDRYMARLSSTYGWVFGQIRVDPSDADTVYIMGLALHVSNDGGKKFRSLRGMHGDHHALWIDPQDPKHLINGNDGGANSSTDGGKTWKLFTKGLPMVQFFNLNYDMGKPFRVYGSIQDHGSRRAIVDISDRDNIPAQDWDRAPGGEGSSHFIDPTDPNIVYSAGFYGQVSRSDLSSQDGEQPQGRRRRGRSTRLLPPTPEGETPPRGQWLAPFILSPHNHKVLYHGMNRLYMSTERGDDLQPISPDLTYNDKATIGDIQYHTIFTIAESHQVFGEIYVGTDDGRVWRTPDGGKQWQEIGAGIPKHRWISRLETSRFTDGTVYMAQNGKRNDDFTPYLWKSSDHGKSWQSIVNNLPVGPINVIREDPKDKQTLYVGTDLGVYISIDGGQSWNTLQKALPSTFVSDLIIHPRDDMIVISTHGRGMYAMDARVLRKQIEKSRDER